ncbi:MAG TPA: hypothetical protein VK841_15760 [Polyangiaceae bacterium]|jgi:hypothetical protein|nr:hypothetical protein [Polyangiaceae bacterium]
MQDSVTPHRTVHVRIHVSVAGASSRIASSLCAACPHAPAGCCSGPPPFRWADIGRVVALGGRDWLLGEIAAGRIDPSGGGLAIARRRGLARPGGPRVAKCVYHGPAGCGIRSETRPAACNYYVCDEALGAPRECGLGPSTERAHGAQGPAAARALHAGLAQRLTAFNAILADRVAADWPTGFSFDAAFLDWLGAEFAALEAGYCT